MHLHTFVCYLCIIVGYRPTFVVYSIMKKPAPPYNGRINGVTGNNTETNYIVLKYGNYRVAYSTTRRMKNKTVRVTGSRPYVALCVCVMHVASTSETRRVIRGRRGFNNLPIGGCIYDADETSTRHVPPTGNP